MEAPSPSLVAEGAMAEFSRYEHESLDLEGMGYGTIAAAAPDKPSGIGLESISLLKAEVYCASTGFDRLLGAESGGGMSSCGSSATPDDVAAEGGVTIISINGIESGAAEASKPASCASPG